MRLYPFLLTILSISTLSILLITPKDINKNLENSEKAMFEFDKFSITQIDLERVILNLEAKKSFIHSDRAEFREFKLSKYKNSQESQTISSDRAILKSKEIELNKNILYSDKSSRIKTEKVIYNLDSEIAKAKAKVDIYIDGIHHIEGDNLIFNNRDKTLFTKNIKASLEL